MTNRNGDSIQKQIKDMSKIIKEYQIKILELQDKCSHPGEALTKVYGANTGNYCPQDDYYWINYVCDICGHRWTEEQ